MAMYEYQTVIGTSHEEPDRDSGGEWTNTVYANVTDEQLDEEGQDGWEAVSVRWGRGGGMREVLMKRPLEEGEEDPYMAEVRASKGRMIDARARRVARTGQ